MLEAVDVARRMAKGVIVAVGPYESDAEYRNLRLVESRLRTQLERDGALRFINLADVPRLYDRMLTLDGYNYNGDGRARVAAAITPVLLDLIAHH